jgi:glycosyltransferase involved in cell wall biosynthesis
MRVLHLNTSDLYGGASRAAYRLHTGLQRIGVDSNMLVQFKQGTDPCVYGPTSALAGFFPKLLRFIDRIPVIFYLKRIEPMFHAQWVPDFVSAKIKELDPDIVHLHWVCGGFIRIESLPKFQKPVVWTLHDMWAFTGGCHLTGDCEKYQESCGTCPQLNSSRENDISRKVWQRKFNSWQNEKLNIITPSKWLNVCAKKSTILKNKKIITIPNGIDLLSYKPTDKNAARKKFNLPLDKKLILFGAMNAIDDENKGFSYLMEAIKKLKENNNIRNCELVIFGIEASTFRIDCNMETHVIGRLNDDYSLAALYSAADVMVVPSKQEAFGQTASESLACGTPVVAFAGTGLLDIVEHEHTGYLATPFNTEDLAKGILWVIENKERLAKLSKEARIKVENDYALTTVAKQYADLYQKI